MFGAQKEYKTRRPGVERGRRLAKKLGEKGLDLIGREDRRLLGKA